MSSTGRSRFLTRIALVAAFAAGALSVGSAGAAGITDTKHNLSSGSTQANHVTGSGATGTDEICVFCHTPHGGSNVLGAPLWNKNLNTAGTGYTLYSSTTMDGAAPSNTLAGSASLVCLSCHDGTQAMDNIINAPGSGGLTTGGGATGLGYTWTTGGTTDTDGRLISGVASLGQDLANDHPIGIPYCGGGLSGAAAVVSGTCADADFKSGANDVKTATIGTLQVFWVDTTVGTPGTRQRTDIQLYSRTGETSPFVECGSCHDPHVKQGEGSAGATFLRIANTGSAVCLACHVK